MVLPFSRKKLLPISSPVIFFPSTMVNLPTPGKTSDFKISVAVAVAPIRHTFDFSREFCPWSPQSLNCRSYLSSKYTKYKFPKNIFHDLIIDKFYRLAFAFWAPEDDGDDGNVSFPPGEGVEAILLLLTKNHNIFNGWLVFYDWLCFLLFC